MFWLRAVKLWIIVSTLASVAGWTLSAMGMLNKTGYVIFTAVTVVLGLLFYRASLFSSLPSVKDLGKMRIRFRRFLPASFAILAVLVFISGMLYAPTGHTAISYRFPRVLHWLAHEQWFWIHTPNYRMNDRACGIEWLTAPFLLFLRSDRGVFLLNAIPFLLMPGLIFSLWTRMGVRPRAAWAWMWLVPTGYCFLMQAGSVANDAFPTVYALAMIDFALRAVAAPRAKGQGGGWKMENGGSSDSLSRSSIPNPLFSNLAFSLLSAALMTGAKASNLPLLLPWAIALVPLLPRLLRALTSDVRVLTSGLAVCFIALLVSFAPTALLNIHYLHDWSGLSVEREGMNMKSPIVGIFGNAFLMFINNFVPTFFPMAGWWNNHMQTFLPHFIVGPMNANFEIGYHVLGELPTEDWSGIGFGISVLVVVSMFAAWRYRRTTPIPGPATLGLWILLLAPWISLLAYCVKSGIATAARLVTPYYPFLLPLLLIGAGQSQVVRRRWWRACAGVVMLLALAALVLTPPRPLWPWKQVLGKALAMRPNQPQLLRAQKVYEVYSVRSDPWAGVRAYFPSDLKIIGFMGTGDDLDISLWKPYGSRRVEAFMLSDSPEEIRRRGIEYTVVGGFNLHDAGTTIEQWLQQSGAELVGAVTATVTVSHGSETFYVVRFKPSIPERNVVMWR